MDDTEGWLAETTGHASARELARTSGIPHSTISRWLRDGKIPLEQVVAIARLYDADAHEAIHRCGYITSDELLAHRTAQAVANAPTADLAYEYFRRTLAEQG